MVEWLELLLKCGMDGQLQQSLDHDYLVLERSRPQMDFSVNLSHHLLGVAAALLLDSVGYYRRLIARAVVVYPHTS